MKAIRLKTEYLTEPLGLGIREPRFFWNCDAERSGASPLEGEGGVTQTAYRIVCTRAGKTVWDSGRVESASMTHIRYAGLPLRSRDIVEWTVMLWDENGEPGETAGSRFELGLLDASDWTAKWISGDYKPDPKRRYPADCFKKDFATKKVVKARLYAAARGVYDVTINGKRIKDFILAPGATDYRKRIQVQTYDVTELIRERNTIELRLADGWYRGSVAAYGVTNVFGAQTSVLAQLELTLADGSVQTIVTNESWAWSNDGSIRFADLKDGEVYDAGMTPSYSGKAVAVKPPEASLVCSDNVPVTEHERFAARDLGGGVYDFGQNLAGYLSFAVKGKPGQKLRIRCGETLNASGDIDLSNMQETRPAKGWNQLSLMRKLMTNSVKGETAMTPMQEILFTCSGGEDTYKTSFAVFGFRYAQFDAPADVEVSDLTAIAVYSDMEQTGDFCCSHEGINRLVENVRWSMKSNFLDVPTDCPTRERLGWTGDAQIFFNTGAYFMDTAAFFRKWLQDMRDAQYKNGLLPAVLPYNGVEMMYKSTGASVGWADAVYLIPYRFWKRYGDATLLCEAWPMTKKYAEYLLKNREKDGSFQKGVQLGEWLEPTEFRDSGPREKHPEEGTAYFYLAMSTMAEVADALGEHELAKQYANAAADSKQAYVSYAELDTVRQAKLVRPLALGLLEGAEKKNAQTRLVRAVENFRYRVGTGFLSTPFLLRVLTEAGESETAYKMLENEEKPGWLYEVNHGATTVWETWEGCTTGENNSGSLNHYSPGAVCEWLFDTCAGIRVAGEHHFILEPVPGGELTHAEARYQSLYGEVRSRWEKTGRGVKFIFEIPANCTAEIRLLDGRTETVSAGRYDYAI